jgi:DNA-binding response OmpR family regulator
MEEGVPDILKVLIVEDDRTTAEFLSKYLEMQGFNVDDC